MKARIKAFAAIALVVLLAPFSAHSAKGGQFQTSPIKNGEHKWRVAYYEGGEYVDYQKIFTETVRGLMKLGWIELRDISTQTGEQTKELWNWLATEVKSDYIEFVADAHYSPGWDDDLRPTIVEALTVRLNEKKDIDLLLAMGTRAGKDFANNLHHTPTLVLSASDPLSSGIIASVDDSGFAHVHATVDPNRYERQVRIFHDIIRFRRLGVAYENSVVGRSYAAIDMIEKVAGERGFDVVHCYTQSDIADQELAGATVRSCFEELVSKVDAIYVTVQGGVNAGTLPGLVALANRRRVPTFSQMGSEEVRSGLLLSISRAGGFRPVGLFLAATIGKIFNGARPRDLNQVFEDSPNIAINLKTAELVGIYLYADVLAAADVIYRDIAIPD